MVLHQSAAVKNTATLEEMISFLSRTCAFPVPVETVDVRQTHISAVFLGGNSVYKLKKPVKLPFLDFSTLELRKHFCEEEVRINQPWAPDVYLGVVPITREADGLQFEGGGSVVDWAVKMRRLDESATLRSRLEHEHLTTEELQRVSCRVSDIHQSAVSAIGEDAAVAESTFRRRFDENWEFARGLDEDILQPQVLDRLLQLSGAWMNCCDAVLRDRAEQGWIRDVHGDLRLEHVFYFPDHPAPLDILILDGIEFDTSLRRTDVVADIAFLSMELAFLGRRDLATIFTESYFTATHDESGRSLLPLFTAYRSAVRAKVAAIVAGESEIPQPAREKAIARSRAHWLWCLTELEEPNRRPALLLISGLPGTGKSTLAKSLAEQLHFEIVRTDVVRKEIFDAHASGQDSASLYSADRTQRVYDECLCRARQRLVKGKRVIVDATFQSDSQRLLFVQLALECGCRIVWLECTAPEDITEQRLDARVGDASDADWAVYQLVRDRWQAPSETTQRFHFTVETGGSAAEAASLASEILQSQGLAEPCNVAALRDQDPQQKS